MSLPGFISKKCSTKNFQTWLAQIVFTLSTPLRLLNHKLLVTGVDTGLQKKTLFNID